MVLSSIGHQIVSNQEQCCSVGSSRIRLQWSEADGTRLISDGPFTKAETRRVDGFYHRTTVTCHSLATSLLQACDVGGPSLCSKVNLQFRYQEQICCSISLTQQKSPCYYCTHFRFNDTLLFSPLIGLLKPWEFFEICSAAPKMELPETQNSRDARIEALWKKLDPQNKGRLDLNGLKKGLQKIDHRKNHAPLSGPQDLTSSQR